jgi:hypothetical protein
MDVKIIYNSEKNRYEGYVDGKMVSRSRHESYVKDNLAKLGFYLGKMDNDVTPKVEEFNVNERFDFLAKMVTMVAKRSIPSAIITGQGGIGKTYTVMKTLKKNGYQDATDLADFEIGSTVNRSKQFKVIKGYSTAKGLYRTLYDCNGSILVFDDCDNILKDATALNLLKSALDSYGERYVSWNAEMDDLPRSFEFTGSIIFISNMDLAKMDQAVRTRALCVDLSMTPMQKVERMEALIKNPEFLPEYEIGHKIESLEFIRENVRVIENISLRTLIAVTKIRGEGGNWQNLAKYIMTQGT